MYENSSIMYKIWIRIYCDFRDKGARILWFLRHNCAYVVILHSSFSVAAAATHEQFWELNLQYLRGRVFIYFRIKPKGNIIGTGGRIFVKYTSTINMQYSFQVFDTEILGVITSLFTVFLHICRKSLQDNLPLNFFHCRVKKWNHIFLLSPLDLLFMVLSWLVLNLYPLYLFPDETQCTASIMFK